MKKCPSCESPVGALDRICSACGNEIPSEVSPIAKNTTAAPTSPTCAADLCAQLNRDVSLLDACPPPSKLGAFITGLITVPTVGLGFLAVKASRTFGATGKSPERIKLALSQNILTAETNYKSDPDIHALVEKTRKKLNDYHQAQHTSRMALMAGMAVSAVVVCVVGISIAVYSGMQANARSAAAAESIRQEAIAATKRAADSAVAALEKSKADHADYLTRYLAERGATGVSAIPKIAVLVADDKSRDQATTQSIVDIVRKGTTNAVTGGLFSEAFVTDGVFAKIFGSDGAEIQKLELTNCATELFLAKKQVQFSNKNDLGIITARLSLAVRRIKADTGAVFDSFTLNSNGPGLNEQEAETIALERAIKQLSEQRISF